MERAGPRWEDSQKEDWPSLRRPSLRRGDVYYPSIFRWLLQIQVIDVGSGEVMGRSFVEINYVVAEGARETCRITAQNLTRR